MNAKYMFKGLWLAGLTLGLASCQNDEIESVAVSTTDGSAITLNCVIGSTVESRAMIQLGNQDESAEYFLWNEGDVLWVKNLGSDGTDTDGETYKFEISSDYSDDNPSNTASFVCSDTTVTISEGDVLCAVYAGSEATEYTTSFVLGDDGYGDWYFGSYSDSEVEEYFKKYMYMYSKVTYSSSNTTLSFEHLTSMIRVSYINGTEEEQQISYLNLSGTNDIWLGYGLSLDEVEGTYSCTMATNGLWNDFTDLTVEPGDTIDFYTLFVPYASTVFSGSSSFKISSDGGEVTFKSSDFTDATNFVTGYRYWFDVTMTDDGLQWTNYVMSAYEEYIEITSETNAALCEWLAGEVMGAYLDDEGNVWIPTEVVGVITYLNVGDNDDLESLDGLECFTNLESLYVQYCNVSSLDLSYFQNLSTLYCQHNNLSSLDVSSNTALKTLNCAGNQLTSLDVSNNTALKILYCSDNQLTNLDVSSNTALKTLWCDGNQLTSLDVSSNTVLQYLYCYDNQLTNLDVSNNTALKTLYCNGNYLSTLDICSLSNLTELTCGNQTNYSSGEEQTLTLTLNESQTTLWYDSWESLDENYNVELNIATSVLDTEYDTSAEDYKNGGKY